MERIKEIWEQLENNTPTVAGLSKLRYSDTSKCDLFLGIKYPENYRLLIIRTPFSVGKTFNFKYELRGLRFDKVYDTDDNGYLLLNLVLVDKQFKDIFDTLITDVITNIINESDLKSILKNYSNRLLKWQSLFEKFGKQGLNPEEQRGLFGELHFLRKYLNIANDFNQALNSWVGPAKEIRDFQAGNWSLEVKTTHGNNHQRIHISNERQLDTSNLDNLILFHLSLEARQQSGESLNQIIDTISESLINDFDALNKFKNKLVETGYFDIHRHLYENTGYFIRQESFYKVENDFPRIEEKDLRYGVGDVKYSIVISQCNEFIITESETFHILTL